MGLCTCSCVSLCMGAAVRNSGLSQDIVAACRFHASSLMYYNTGLKNWREICMLPGQLSLYVKKRPSRAS